MNAFTLKMFNHTAIIYSNSPEFLQKAKNFFSTLVVDISTNNCTPERKYFVDFEKGNIYKDNTLQEKLSSLKEISSIDEMIFYLLWLLDKESLSKKRNDYLFLHTSAVAFGKDIILFPATFGCGKTTIAISLFLKGAKYIADDLVVINPKDLSLYPFSFDIHIDDKTLSLFPELASKVNNNFYFKFPNQKRGKNYYIPPEIVREDGTLNGHLIRTNKDWKIKLILFQKYFPHLKGNVLKEISKPRTIMELIKNTNSDFYFKSREKLIDTYGSLISGAQCFYFERTDPIEKAADAILNLL